MDLMPKQITIMVFAQGVLVLLLLFANSRRLRRKKASMAESSAEEVPLSSQPWVWVAGAMVGLAAVLLLMRPFTTWYWAHYPPAVEHRRELLDIASKQLLCPAEQLTIRPFGQRGAEVTGCDGKMKVCWEIIPGTRGHYAWTGCYTP
jgi:hypothetical protein